MRQFSSQTRRCLPHRGSPNNKVVTRNCFNFFLCRYLILVGQIILRLRLNGFVGKKFFFLALWKYRRREGDLSTRYKPILQSWAVNMGEKRATGQSNLADRKEDCYCPQSSYVIRKSKLETFVVQPAVGKHTFSYCAWLWKVVPLSFPCFCEHVTGFSDLVDLWVLR